MIVAEGLKISTMSKSARGITKNPGKNILAAGHAVLACGEDALANSMKQEPLNMGDLVSA